MKQPDSERPKAESTNKDDHDPSEQTNRSFEKAQKQVGDESGGESATRHEQKSDADGSEHIMQSKPGEQGKEPGKQPEHSEERSNSDKQEHRPEQDAQANSNEAAKDTGGPEDGPDDGPKKGEQLPGHDQPHRKPTDLKAVKSLFLDQKQKIKTKAHPPGGYDDTPLPDAPPGYTVRFVFHRAENLPAADLATASSDPFVLATLRAANPRRHKEEPDLVHRTRTLRRRTSPEWEDEWIVANVPPSGFSLKCRIFDEDSADHNDRLGNVTIRVPHVGEDWEGFPPPGREFRVQKRVGSKRAYLLKAVVSAVSSETLTPSLWVSAEVLGKSDPPHAQMYTVGPTTWIKHFSPMIGRLTGTKVHCDEGDDVQSQSSQKKSKKYDFQANEIQLSGPVPEKLYHRYVEFRPTIGLMFSSHGIRGKILNKALHKQHSRVYNFDRSTEYGAFEPCSEEATMQFLRMAHFDEGGRIFTYVLTLDAAFRFTETGKEFGIDMLSKHTMHSDVATYIASSGEFFVRRLERPDASNDPEPNERTHPDKPLPGGPPRDPPPHNPLYYQLVIDNDSGTYRPDKSVLPELKTFLERNLPGLGIVVMHCQDKELARLKEKQAKAKTKEGNMINMVMNRSLSSSSMSSTESALDAVERAGDGPAAKSTRERALDVVEEPRRLKEMLTRGES